MGHSGAVPLQGSYAANTMKHAFVVLLEEAGERLDRVVTSHCPDLSRTRVQELIESALILLNGRAVKGSHRLHGGERITVEAQPRPPVHANLFSPKRRMPLRD